MTCLKWIATATVLFLFLLAGIALATLLSMKPPTQSPPSPSFKARQCLALNERERWQPVVFAEILQVGESNYLLDLSPYKRRSKFADIAAYTLPFDFIETTTSVVACPERH